MKEQLEQPRTTKVEKGNETKEQKPKTSPISEKTSKEQKSETPPTEIIKEQKPKLPTSIEGSDVKKAEMPSIEDINALLEKSKEVITVALISEKEIDEMIKKRKQALDHLQNIKAIYERHIQRIKWIEKNCNLLKDKDSKPLIKDLKPNDYELLIKGKIINEEFAKMYKTTPDQLKKTMIECDNVIAKFKTLKSLSVDESKELEKLLKIRDSFREKLENKIKERQETLKVWCEETKNKMSERYTERVKKLKEIITNIESNPRVIERLNKEQEEKRKEFIKEVTRYIQSAGVKHENTFKKRLKELFENDKLVDKLVAALDEKDTQKKQNIFDQVRSNLINAIINGKGEKQLKDPKEIVPWEAKTSVPYGEAIDFLRSFKVEDMLLEIMNDRNTPEKKQEQVQELLRQRHRIIKENEVIRRLVGSRWIINPKTNERKKGIFWAAFDTRKEKDEKEIATKEKQKTHQENIS